MQLDLVDGGHVSVSCDQALEVLDVEVGDADRAGAPLALELLERLPGLDVAVLARHRPVDEVEVDVVESEPLAGWPSNARCACVAPWSSFHSLVVMKSSLAGDAGGGDRPRRRPPRCGRRRRCRCGGSRPRARRSTTASVSAGGTWKTPKPSWGISRPSFRRRVGTFWTWVMLSRLPARAAANAGLRSILDLHGRRLARRRRGGLDRRVGRLLDAERARPARRSRTSP